MKKTSNHKRMQQIAAWIGILVIAALFIAGILLSLFGGASLHNLSIALILCGSIVSILIYALLWVTRVWTDKNDADHKEENR